MGVGEGGGVGGGVRRPPLRFFKGGDEAPPQLSLKVWFDRKISRSSAVYRTVNMYSDLKLRMGPSESSFQSSRVPKVCGRASEV
jgi:hypothetical protein